MANPESLEFDYVVVGGGSAGAVVAARLSEDARVRVALVEAGGEARGFLVALPVGFARLVGHKTLDWKYEQLPDSSIGGRHFLWSAGKLLGGSSSINGQVYIRGTQEDFDHWHRAGATGWGFDDVLPYFLRSEQWRGAPSQARGAYGPLSVAPIREVHPLCPTFLQACREIGLPLLADYNSGDMEGAFVTQASQRNGWRCSTEKAYLRPARSRRNLQVFTHCEAERIIFDGRCAVGMNCIRDGKRLEIRARGEVIVSAGAMGSPALLMRSGIGPGDDLQSLGIPVIQDHTEVGRNLQEHCAASQNRFVNQPTLNSRVGPLDMLGYAWRFVSARKGPFSTPPVHAMALVRTRDGLDEFDVQLNFIPMTYDINPESISSASVHMPQEPAVTVAAHVAHPFSRGRVVLGGDRRPWVDHRIIGDERDVKTLVQAMKLIDRLFKTDAFSWLAPKYRAPASLPASDEDWADFVRAKAMIAYHSAGSCRMGSDPRAVVDPQLRVNGFGSLRIVDASVMPRITATNTNAATIMIGEKAAEMIARDG